MGECQLNYAVRVSEDLIAELVDFYEWRVRALGGTRPKLDPYVPDNLDVMSVEAYELDIDIAEINAYVETAIDDRDTIKNVPFDLSSFFDVYDSVEYELKEIFIYYEITDIYFVPPLKSFLITVMGDI